MSKVFYMFNLIQYDSQVKAKYWNLEENRRTDDIFKHIQHAASDHDTNILNEDQSSIIRTKQSYSNYSLV